MLISKNILSRTLTYPDSFEHLLTTIFLWDTYQPASELAFTDRIQPTRPTTFLTNAYPTDKTPIFTLSPRKALLQQV